MAGAVAGGDALEEGVPGGAGPVGPLAPSDVQAVALATRPVAIARMRMYLRIASRLDTLR